MIEIIQNICSTSFITLIVSWFINGAFMPENKMEMSNIHAITFAVTFLLPALIFVLSLIILIWVK